MTDGGGDGVKTETEQTTEEGRRDVVHSSANGELIVFSQAPAMQDSADWLPASKLEHVLLGAKDGRSLAPGKRNSFAFPAGLVRWVREGLQLMTILTGN
jgi:hypothetical protein